MGGAVRLGRVGRAKAKLSQRYGRKGGFARHERGASTVLRNRGQRSAERETVGTRGFRKGR